MEVFQSASFARAVKKLPKNQKFALDSEIRKISADPSIGQEKKGDLAGVFVHKCRLGKSPFLLAYRHSSEIIELIMLGPHENYYRDLKKRLHTD